MNNQINLKTIEDHNLVFDIVLRDTNAYRLGTKKYEQYADHVSSRWLLKGEVWDMLLDHYITVKS